ncbi:MAG: GxxExxY protein [Fimbriimonadales bacterium]
MTENEIAAIIVDAAFAVHIALGPGLLESVYERALEHELRKRGLTVVRQWSIPCVYDGKPLGDPFRADMLVEGKVVVELKSLEIVPKVAYKIVLTYLRLGDKRLGLLINFGEEYIKDGIKRIVNNLQE